MARKSHLPSDQEVSERLAEARGNVLERVKKIRVWGVWRARLRQRLFREEPRRIEGMPAFDARIQELLKRPRTPLIEPTFDELIQQGIESVKSDRALQHARR